MRKQTIKQRYSKRVKALGLTLRKIRRAKEITQEQLAEESGVSINSINTLEKGSLNPTLATILALADALKVNPKDLLD